MRVRASRIGAEIALLALILATIFGSVALVVTVYRAKTKGQATPATVAQAPPRPSAPEPPPSPAKPPEEVAPPQPEDLTPAKLAEIAAKEAEIVEARKSLERKAVAIEAASQAARAVSDRYRVRERLIRTEAAKADTLARRVEDEVDLLARERDILAARRDDERKELEHASLRARDGVAVLPYKGANGTWRRPIPIECRGGSAQLQPGGPMYSIADLSGFVNRRTHPLVGAVARAMVRTRDLATPDGVPAVPYIYFIVRPDGIREFYAARGLLEPLGIAFGYELVDADADIEFPDLNDPKQWGEPPPGSKPAAWPLAPSASELAGNSGSGTGPGGRFEGSGPGRGLAPAGNPPAGPGEEGLGGRPGSPLNGLPPVGTRRMGVTASRNSREETEKAWNRLGTVRDLSNGGLEAEELEALARAGNGGSGGFRDGRVPVVPRDLEPASEPMFDPPPRSEILGEFDGRSTTPPSRSQILGEFDGGGTAQADARRDPRRSQPRGSAGRVPGLVGDAPSPLPGNASPRSLSEAIARNEGLQAPRLSVPSRSIPAGGGAEGATSSSNPSGAGVGTSANAGQAGTPTGTPGGVAGSSGSPSGSAGGAAGTSSERPPGGAAGSGGERPPGAVASASSAAGGGMPSSDGSGSGGGQGWDDSNGITSKSFDVNVACGPKGIVIHPGGRTLTLDEMTARDDALPRALAAVVRTRSDAEPNVGLRPKVKFLVKPGGEGTYLKAQYQVSRSGSNWPTTMKVADRSTPRLFDGARP